MYMECSSGPRRKDKNMSGKRSRVGSERQQKITPLRKLMIADMEKRSFCPLTQKMYIRAVVALVKHYGKRSPEQISLAEAQAYLRYQQRCT